MLVVYYSTKSGNTKRLAERLKFETLRIEDHRPPPVVDVPFILITPSYGGGYIPKSVPKSVIKFLNVETNRHLIKGVVSTGNTNFGIAYGAAADVISRKCKIPIVGRVELFGTEADVAMLNQRIQALTDSFS